MENETPAYVNGLKQAAFRNGLALPMLSIHQDFVSPNPEERKKARRPHEAVHRTRRASSAFPPSA